MLAVGSSLLLVLLLAGCATNDAPAGSSSSSASQSTTSTLGVTNTTAPPAPAITSFSTTADFTVTYVSPAPSQGSNAGQLNCLNIGGVEAVLDGNATMTWTAGPSTASMELVVGVVGQAPLARLQGASPLQIPFEIDDLTGKAFFVAAQSDPTGAAIAQQVTLVVSFRHPASASLEFAQATCAY